MLKLVRKVFKSRFIGLEVLALRSQGWGRVVGWFCRLTNWAAAWPMEMEERDAGFCHGPGDETEANMAGTS